MHESPHRIVEARLFELQAIGQPMQEYDQGKWIRVEITWWAEQFVIEKPRTGRDRSHFPVEVVTAGPNQLACHGVSSQDEDCQRSNRAGPIETNPHL